MHYVSAPGSSPNGASSGGDVVGEAQALLKQHRERLAAAAGTSSTGSPSQPIGSFQVYAPVAASAAGGALPIAGAPNQAAPIAAQRQ